MGKSTDVSPAAGVVAITPSDTVNVFGGNIRGFMVGVAGDVAVIMVDGSTLTLTGLTAGTIYPLQVSRFLATGTTATGIVGLR